MKNLFKVIYLPFAVLCLISCHHDKPEAPKYRVSKANYYSDNGSIEQTSTYTYSNNQISRIDVSGDKSYYFTYEYSGSKISKRNDFWTPGATSSDAYEIITYNSDGTIGSFLHYSKNGGGTYTKDLITSFFYSNGQLNKITVSNFLNGTSSLQEEYDYTYTSGNITTVNYIDATSTPQSSDTFTYTFDNNANYFNKLFFQPLFTDEAFDPLDESTMPIINSTNNISSVKVSNTNTPITYTLDDNKNLAKVLVGGIQSVSYEFTKY